MVPKNLKEQIIQFYIFSSRTLLNSFFEARKTLIIKPDKGIIIKENDRSISLIYRHRKSQPILANQKH